MSKWLTNQQMTYQQMTDKQITKYETAPTVVIDR